METADQSDTSNFNLEPTELRGANEAMTQRIEALTKVVEALVAVQVRNQDSETPMTKEESHENPLNDEESKTPIDPTFTRMTGRLKFTDRHYSDDGSVERRVSIRKRQRQRKNAEDNTKNTRDTQVLLGAYLSEVQSNNYFLREDLRVPSQARSHCPWCLLCRDRHKKYSDL